MRLSNPLTGERQNNNMQTICIPYGGYWCTPFAKWQGSLAHLHSLEFAAYITRQALASRSLDGSEFDYGVLGMTIPQQSCFYGLPWLTAMAGMDHIAGPTVSQACATSARVLATAAGEIRSGLAECALAVTADRVSNGPHLYYPDPLGPGGAGQEEDWVMNNFNQDPYVKCDMTRTAENCASRWNVSVAEQHEVVLRRYEQYQQALEPLGAATFQQKYMELPLQVPDKKYRKTVASLMGDEGITETSMQKMAGLKPVHEGGVITYASQTHPADGNAGMIITTAEKARALSRDPALSISIVAFGQARAEPAWMPAAPIPASRQALALAGLTIHDVKAIKSHNPFAVNDIIFAREMGIDVMAMNNYGCSLIWGHPQGPTGMRAIIELIEELVLRGGGYGLFHGCAAGDSAMALVLRVD